MDSYLLIFRITQVLFFRGFRKTILMGSEQPYAIKAAGVLGQAKFYSGDLNFLNPVSAINLARQSPFMKRQVIC